MPTIIWDAGTNISGEGSVVGSSPLIRVHVTSTLPGESQTNNVPPRYYNLGTVGEYAGSYRDPGARLIYAQQEFSSEMSDADGWYWVLPAGVSGVLYRGVVMADALVVACEVERSTAQSIATASTIAVIFDIEVRDPFNMHSPTTNPSRVTIPVAGWYYVTGNVAWGASAAGERDVNLFLNSATYVKVDTRAPLAGVVLSQPISALLWLNAGDYVEVVGYQTSGGNLDMNANLTVKARLSVIKVG